MPSSTWRASSTGNPEMMSAASSVSISWTTSMSFAEDMDEMRVLRRRSSTSRSASEALSGSRILNM